MESDINLVANELNREGFVVIDSGLPGDLLDKARVDTDELVRIDWKKNPSYYHYNESPRLIEGWRHSSAIKRISLCPNVLNILNYVFSARAVPFSTINFVKGTEQPFHADTFHFGSIPEHRLAGVWVALEDVDPEAGPLSLAAGSQNLPPLYLDDLNLEIPTTPAQIKANYTRYEEFVRIQVENMSSSVRTPVVKKGQCIIWLGNVLHGACKIKNPNATRYSQVTHYHFEDSIEHYNPGFSTRTRRVKRDISLSIITD